MQKNLRSMGCGPIHVSKISLFDLVSTAMHACCESGPLNITWSCNTTINANPRKLGSRCRSRVRSAHTARYTVLAPQAFFSLTNITYSLWSLVRSRNAWLLEKVRRGASGYDKWRSIDELHSMVLDALACRKRMMFASIVIRSLFCLRFQLDAVAGGWCH